MDFLSHRYKLIVEADGGQHDAEDPAEKARNAFLVSEGFQVIRFWNHDILANIDGVLETIARNIDQGFGDE